MPRAERTNIENHIWVFCPGCKCYHVFDARWSFNGDFEKPTFRPSMLVNGSHAVSDEYLKEHPGMHRCHSFVTDGMIQFLNDSTHELAGLTVELPDLD